MGERALPFQSFMGKIQPKQSAEEIYGKGCVYSPKLYAQNYEHFGGDLLSLEALTGRELAAAGNMPVICHEGTVTEGALHLFEKAGLSVPAIQYTYRNDQEYLALLQQLGQQGMKVVFQYPHPPEDADPSISWVSAELIAYLSDKRSIPELVPAKHVARRRMVSLVQLFAEKPRLPFVLKTGDGRPTSGGCGVLLIEEEGQLQEVSEEFGDLSSIIMEEFIEYDWNFGFHYTVDQAGNIHFLGKSEQVVNEDNCFRGSWISPEAAPFERVVEAGFQVMRNMAAKGYTGAAGFDVLIRGEDFYFVDLNIRFNASTSSLMLYDDIKEKYGKDVMRFSFMEWNGPFTEGLSIAEKYVDRGQFIPLSLLDAAYVESSDPVSRITGLVIGHSVDEVEMILEEMEQDRLMKRK